MSLAGQSREACRPTRAGDVEHARAGACWRPARKEVARGRSTRTRWRGRTDDVATSRSTKTTHLARRDGRPGFSHLPRPMALAWTDARQRGRIELIAPDRRPSATPGGPTEGLGRTTVSSATPNGVWENRSEVQPDGQRLADGRALVVSSGPPTDSRRLVGHRAEIAQLVEHATENRGVASSILALGTIASVMGHRGRKWLSW